ncbi:MAG: hypothetical protein U0W24_21340 [Bacteroidales bacterium]
MDRKEFLKTLWFKIFMPLLLIGVLIFSVRFLIRIFTQNDSERFISIILIGFIILSTLVYILGLAFKKITNQIKSKLPEKHLRILMIIGKVQDYILPIALGMIIYHSWQRNGTSSVAFFGAFLIMKIIDIVKKEKLATTRNIANGGESK